MLRLKRTIIALSMAATMLAAMPSDVNADGPLRRWLRGLRTPKTNTCCPPAVATAAPNPYNLKPGQCMKTCQQTCSRTVVNYVPCTAYRTVTKRVPVTQYRPETTSDPCTGCVVTCMKPCTTYTYQCERVPYTTYRPVYRQETYKVPVTTITNDCSTGTCAPCATGTCATGTCATGACATGTCGTCSTCTTGVSQQPNYAPTPASQTQTYYESPGPVSTGGGFTPSPADRTPSLNPTSYQRPVTERLITPIGSGYQTLNQPAKINTYETASRSPIREQWSYSPVRLASYEKPATTRVRVAPVTRQVTPLKMVRPAANWSNPQPVKRNNGWVEVN